MRHTGLQKGSLRGLLEANKCLSGAPVGEGECKSPSELAQPLFFLTEKKKKEKKIKADQLIENELMREGGYGI